MASGLSPLRGRLGRDRRVRVLREGTAMNSIEAEQYDARTALFDVTRAIKNLNHYANLISAQLRDTMMTADEAKVAFDTWAECTDEHPFLEYPGLPHCERCGGPKEHHTYEYDWSRQVAPFGPMPPVKRIPREQ